MRQTTLFATKPRQPALEGVVFLAERRQILLQGMMFQPCVQGGLTQGGANLDRLADAHGVHT